jgi:hypothetical protein
MPSPTRGEGTNTSAEFVTQYDYASLRANVL